MELVSEMNNGGAAFLASGNVDAAFSSFRGALELIGRMYEGGEDPQIPLSAPTFAASGAKTSSLASSNKEGLKAKPNRSTCPSQPSTRAPVQQIHPLSKPSYDHPHFVYCQALVFNPSLSLTMENWDEYLPICLAMIKFNLGLTYQMKSKDVGERALVRALVWYDLCLAHVQETMQTALPLHLNVVMAAMNNMAIVNYDLCHYTKVRHIYQNLLEIMNCHSSAGSKPLGFKEEEMQGLVLNIILLHSDAIAPAA